MKLFLMGVKSFKFKTFIVIIDSLLSGLSKRLDADRDINDRFGVFDMDCKDADLCKQANALSCLYPTDLEYLLSDELI